MIEQDTSREAVERMKSAMWRDIGLKPRDAVAREMAAAGWLCPEDARALLARAEAAEAENATLRARLMGALSLVPGEATLGDLRAAADEAGALLAQRDALYEKLRRAHVERDAAVALAYAAGFRGGAEAMREAAAEHVATHAYQTSNVRPPMLVPHFVAKSDMHHQSIAAAIRALPLPEPQEPPR